MGGNEGGKRGTLSIFSDNKEGDEEMRDTPHISHCHMSAFATCYVI